MDYEKKLAEFETRLHEMYEDFKDEGMREEAAGVQSVIIIFDIIFNG